MQAMIKQDEVIHLQGLPNTGTFEHHLLRSSRRGTAAEQQVQFQHYNDNTGSRHHENSEDKANQEKTERKRMLNEWYLEWDESEREHEHSDWKAMAGTGLLLEPARINVDSHTDDASNACLCFYGDSYNMPDGARAQLARWKKAQQQADAGLAAFYSVGSKQAPILIESPAEETPFGLYRLGSKQAPIVIDTPTEETHPTHASDCQEIPTPSPSISSCEQCSPFFFHRLETAQQLQRPGALHDATRAQDYRPSQQQLPRVLPPTDGWYDTVEAIFNSEAGLYSYPGVY